MNKYFFGMIVLFSHTLFLSAPYSSYGETSTKSPAPVIAQTKWKEKMQGLYQSLSDLLTDVCSDERYYDSKNAARIEREIKSISTFSHELNKNSKEPAQADPTLQLFSGFLANETNEAYRSFRDGQIGYARDILRSVPGNCLACHSRNASGPDFVSLPLEPSAALKPIEKAEFYAATRQFDRAIELYQKVIRGQEKPKLDFYGLEKAERDALLIAVRFKRDPALAKAIVQSALDNTESPRFLKDDAAQWKKSIEEWELEVPREIKTEEGLYAESQRLIARARTVQTYSMDHSADIIYLRASTTLYDLVQAAPNGKHVSEALLLLGMCYEVLSPHRMENLHNVYYEACIERSPHSEIARTCYRRYEQSMYLGFTGSAGTHLPQEIKKHLLDLWAIAMKNKGEL